MKIGVTGDTHGMNNGLNRVLTALCNVDCLLHTGDFYRDALFLKEALGVPCFQVAGNNDFEGPLSQVVTLDGVSIFLTHGHRYHDVTALSYAAEQHGCGIAVFGHTHVPLLQYVGKVLILNPGSPSRPRGKSQPSCAVIIIENGEAKAHMITV